MKKSNVSESIKFVKLNKNLNFEKKPLYILFAPFFLIIAVWVWFKKKMIPNPKTNFYFFDGISRNCRIIKENAANWRALDLTYNNYSENDNLFGNLMYNFFWYNLKNPPALRNRLKLTKFLLFKNIEKISKKNEEIRVVSIASGSAQGLLETIAEFKQKKILIKAILIDLDSSALENSKKIAQKLGIESQVSALNKSASIISEIGREFKPNLIEMVGFLEYRPLEKAVKLVSSIFQSLDKNGTFLISQIAPNIESFFLKEVVSWPMIYRGPKELAKILSLVGFDLKNCVFHTEPLRIHFIAECKKYD